MHGCLKRRQLHWGKSWNGETAPLAYGHFDVLTERVCSLPPPVGVLARPLTREQEEAALLLGKTTGLALVVRRRIPWRTTATMSA